MAFFALQRMDKTHPALLSCPPQPPPPDLNKFLYPFPLGFVVFVFVFVLAVFWYLIVGYVFDIFSFLGGWGG